MSGILKNAEKDVQIVFDLLGLSTQEERDVFNAYYTQSFDFNPHLETYISGDTSGEYKRTGEVDFAQLEGSA